jgi:hypothetical protein
MAITKKAPFLVRKGAFFELNLLTYGNSTA